MQVLFRVTRRAFALLGIEGNTTSHREKLIAAIGAVTGITAVCVLSHWILGPLAAVLMVASMGASAVLLFAVPHGALSQPWAVVGGHLLSGFVGVTSLKLLGDHLLLPALAVGLAVAVMHYARCIHPPGGATALAVVGGGDAVADLGYSFLLMPLTLNVLAILATAMVFNNFFVWRRYPASLMPAHRNAHRPESTPGLTHEDLAAAMESLETYVDITSEELADLFERAWAHARQSQAAPVTIGGGRFYSNGHPGAEWAVRQIVDLPTELPTPQIQLIYKTVAGRGSQQTGICALEDFNRWARFEVAKKGERWIKVAAPAPVGQGLISDTQTVAG